MYRWSVDRASIGIFPIIEHNLLISTLDHDEYRQEWPMNLVPLSSERRRKRREKKIVFASTDQVTDGRISVSKDCINDEFILLGLDTFFLPFIWLPPALLLSKEREKSKVSVEEYQQLNLSFIIPLTRIEISSIRTMHTSTTTEKQPSSPLNSFGVPVKFADHLFSTVSDISHRSASFLGRSSSFKINSVNWSICPKFVNWLLQRRRKIFDGWHLEWLN